jgi:gliding motility-associated-like protein
VGTDVDGCRDSARVNVSVVQRVATAIGPNDTLCKGQSAQLTASGGIAYLWTPSDGLSDVHSANPTATPDFTTTYTALITENECFTDTSYVTVVVNPIPTVALGPDQTIIAGSSITLKPTTTGMITSYNWAPNSFLNCTDCANPVATPDGTITYTVTVSTNGGCTATDDIKIDLGCANSQVFIPNTFTPNNDGNNDKFYASGQGISIINRFSVYDRWGELIYEADNIPINDPKYGWDGTYKGQKLKPDVYVYIIYATCETGTPLHYKGDISIVR